MDREQLLAFIKYLQSQGVPEKEITNMFGEYFGIEKDKKDQPDYTGMFEKYMPTFGQIESIQDPNSLMKSIAKDISSGVPIWDIKNGIAAAIENNVAGVDPSITFDEYVSYAKTLEGELQSYTNFARTEEAKFGENKTLDVSETYNWRDVFPDQLKQVTDYAKLNPIYRMGAVGSGADMPARVVGNAPAPTSSMDAQTILEKAKSAMYRGEDFTVAGKIYSPEQLRDEIVPKLESDAKMQKENIKVLKNLQDRWKRSTRTTLDSAKKEWKSAGFDRNSYLAAAKAKFDFGGSGDAYKESLALIDAEYERKKNNYFKLKEESNNVPTDFYSLLESTNKTYYDGQVKGGTLKPNFSLPSTGGKKINTPSTTGPNGYVGPRGGESTMSREYNPDLLKFLSKIDKGLTQKITDSGRTPAIDKARDLATYYKALKGIS
jgi:hypothetical protein